MGGREYVRGFLSDLSGENKLPGRSGSRVSRRAPRSVILLMTIIKRTGLRKWSNVGVSQNYTLGESWFQLRVLRHALHLPRGGERATTADERKCGRTSRAALKQNSLGTGPSQRAQPLLRRRLVERQIVAEVEPPLCSSVDATSPRFAFCSPMF